MSKKRTAFFFLRKHHHFPPSTLFPFLQDVQSHHPFTHSLSYTVPILEPISFHALLSPKIGTTCKYVMHVCTLAEEVLLEVRARLGSLLGISVEVSLTGGNSQVVPEITSKITAIECVYIDSHLSFMVGVRETLNFNHNKYTIEQNNCQVNTCTHN